ncbi:MAG TPA: YtxH domain-containing protein [Dermatophilaceae bacterium]|nr:YtxH domain-containing protein [Dermatophilaceae bacterium]
MKKLTALVALGVGYVLGARAGRKRYDQIAAQANKLWHNPKVEERKAQAADLAKQTAGTAGTAAYEKAKDAATHAAAAAKTKADELTHRHAAGEETAQI